MKSKIIYGKICKNVADALSYRRCGERKKNKNTKKTERKERSHRTRTMLVIQRSEGIFFLFLSLPAASRVRYQSFLVLYVTKIIQ